MKAFTSGNSYAASSTRHLSRQNNVNKNVFNVPNNMINEKQLQYTYLERLRRQTLYKYQLYNLKIQRIQNIQNYLRAGGSKDDPEIKDEYYALAAEFGEGIFVLEGNVGNNVPLTKEEQEISNA